MENISIHAPQARGDTFLSIVAEEYSAISIHAPQARGDLAVLRYIRRLLISIHAPQARGDFCVQFFFTSIHPFQSTPRKRGATQLDLIHVN